MEDRNHYRQGKKGNSVEPVASSEIRIEIKKSDLDVNDESPIPVSRRQGSLGRKKSSSLTGWFGANNTARLGRSLYQKVDEDPHASYPSSGKPHLLLMPLLTADI